MVDFPELFAPRRTLTFLLRLIVPDAATDLILLNSRVDTHIPLTRYLSIIEYSSHQRHYTLLAAFVYKFRKLRRSSSNHVEKPFCEVYSTSRLHCTNLL